ncbi:LWR-salt protein [Halobacteria archaeon HArc-gm2]|nr:LWR-salt protein [Halobacteria archaeon HArc-gm2]
MLPDGGSEGESTKDVGTASYVFRVRFRVEPGPPELSVEPNSFETVLYREADRPGSEGWLFFRDNLWRGDLGDEAHFRELTEEALDVPVTEVSFRELQTEGAYLDELKERIAADLDLFNADTVSEVLTKYLGSSIRVE